MENMFIRNVDDEQQHINLSHDAWDVIDDDIRSFYTHEADRSFSGFMNRIFINFYERADATFSARKNEYRAELRDALGGLGRTAETIAQLVNARTEKLKAAARSYKKGDGRKFRLNNESQAVLDGHPDSGEYDSRADYLKAVFEQYATLPAFEREAIFFKDTMDKITDAIALGKRIRITLLPKPEDGGVKFIFSVKPYAVRHDKNRLFNYLIGYSERLDEKHEPVFGDEHAACFRISRIKDIRRTEQRAFISKDKRDELENTIRSKGVQYMSGELIDVTVKFSDKGLDDFNRQSYMRPQHYEKTKSGENTYVFKCTEFQASNYFFRLGAGAQVIEPAALRESLRSRFEEAAKAYGK